jgi:hypothetical protein
MKYSYAPYLEKPVRLGDKIAAIIAGLPPQLADKVRRDTLRALRDARDERRKTWKRQRRKRWVSPDKR